MLKFSIMSTPLTKQKIQIVTLAHGQLLLLQFAKIHNQGFQNITGSVENGETFKEAAERELEEEIGLIAPVVDLNHTFIFTDRWGYQVEEKVFACFFSTLPSITLSDEHQSYKWVPINEVVPEDFVFATNYEAFKKAVEYHA